MRALEQLGRTRLSRNFYLRDFLYSEIADFYAIPNIPHDPERAIQTGRHLCTELLEPLRATFGRIGIRSGYRAIEVTEFGNKRKEGGVRAVQFRLSHMGSVGRAGVSGRRGLYRHTVVCGQVSGGRGLARSGVVDP